jgi:predicted O-methyltransferase YrrM
MRVGQMARLMVRDRVLAREYLRAFAGAQRDHYSIPDGSEGSSADSAELRSPSAAASEILARVGRPLAVGPRLPVARDRVQKGPEGSVDSTVARVSAGLDADPALGELAYMIVRGLEPDVILETGVAGGVTSAYILAALEDNGHGRLVSIDLPPLPLESAGLVGHFVPGDWRGRWSYHRGSSRRLLPQLLAELGAVDVFVHDSDHSYANMRWELETAWSSLRPGGLVVADDVQTHRAFADMAAASGARPVYAEQPGKRGATGLLVRT